MKVLKMSIMNDVMKVYLNKRDKTLFLTVAQVIFDTNLPSKGTCCLVLGQYHLKGQIGLISKVHFCHPGIHFCTLKIPTISALYMHPCKGVKMGGALRVTAR